MDRRTAFLAGFASLTAGCAAPAKRRSVAELIEDVTAVELAFAKTMADRDHAAFLAHVADEAVFLNAGQPLTGKAAIGAHWLRFFGAPAAPFAWKPDLVQVLASGTLAQSIGPSGGPAARWWRASIRPGVSTAMAAGGSSSTMATTPATAHRRPDPMAASTPITNPTVAQVFAGYPPAARGRLMALRALILETAARTTGVGALEETLKWGEPAYLTSQSGSGSTLRIGWKKAAPAQVAVYFNCKTSLVETFRTLFPHDFQFEGQRAIVFDEDRAVPRDALAFCIATALTYHRTAKTGPGRA